MRALVLATLFFSGLASAAEPYVPPAPEDIPNYWQVPLCHPAIEDDPDTDEDESSPPFCGELSGTTLRQLSILRNTIFARYGWAGFRKTWLREHFQRQPWFKPNPKFSYKLLSDVDRQNVRDIAGYEMGFLYEELEEKRDDLLVKAGKWWGDVPSYAEDGEEGKQVYACDLRFYRGEDEDELGHPLYELERFREKADASKDCTYRSSELAERAKGRKKYQPVDPIAPDFSKLAPEERIELGLLSRAMGSFASDEASRGQAEKSLDEVLSLKELRELSLRDLRLLRNTLYARRGRPFKSPLLQKHFAHMPWYKADPAYTDARLTKNDLRNVKLIQSVEKELGGALKDEDFLIADPGLRPEEAPDPGFLSGA